MTLHENRYRRWSGAHCGIWRRRWVITVQGLFAALKNKWLRRLIVLCWGAALLQTICLFFLGQLLVPDSLPHQWAPRLDSMGRALISSLTSWLQQHPEISVRVAQNILFYYFALYLQTFSLLAVALAIPHLIGRDIASRAIVIYSAKAVSRADYFLGKWGVLMGVMTLTWLGPLCTAWLAGNLLSPRWNFFWHSRLAIAHAAGFTLFNMAIIAVLGLGVSALSSREKVNTALWLAFWFLGNAIVPIASETEPWLKYASFSYDLRQIPAKIFRLSDDFRLARENIPVLGRMLQDVDLSSVQSADWVGALAALGVMVALAVSLLLWRIRPE